MTSRTARSAIAVAGLRKSFGDQVVLDGIDLQVPEGTVFALLGPNGAGKTTTVQILSTLTGADAGEVRVAGHDLAREPDAVRAAIGVTGQFSAVDQLLTGEENLRLMADLGHLDRAAGRRRAAELLDRFDLVEAAGKPAGTYSGGMRRRLDLAMGLVGDPRIIFLDEPTAGLDPRSRRTMWQLIRELVAGGVTIFLTTQYLEEADELADQVALLDHGRLIAEGAPETLKRRVPGGHIRLQFPTRTGSNRRLAPSGTRCATTTRSPSRSRATVASGRCGRCSTGSTGRRSRSVGCRSTRPTSTTSSSPSPANPTRKGQPCHEHPRLRGARLQDDAAPQPPPHVALPDPDPDGRRHPGRLPAAVVYVFGGTLGAGLGGPGGGRADYLAYVTPGILLMAVAGVAQGTAISVAMDMTEGIIARFRTMAIFRPSILTGHVVSAMTQTAASLAIVLAVALLIGFRPTASPVEWTAAVGVLAMITLAITWLSVACGLVSKTVEAASNLPMPLMLLPFLGSGFVPTESMATALRWFAEYQPFTPFIETLRGLLLGTAIGNSAAVAVAWCVGITLASFLWARAAFNRDPGPAAT
jgi:ABC-2 type transport system ATP-binding protein